MRQSKQTITFCDGPNCANSTTEHFSRRNAFGEDALIPEDWTLITPYDDTSNIRAFCSWGCAAAFCGAKVVEERRDQTVTDQAGDGTRRTCIVDAS